MRVNRVSVFCGSPLLEKQFVVARKSSAKEKAVKISDKEIFTRHKTEYWLLFLSI